MSNERWFPPNREGSKVCLQKWSQVSLYLWDNTSSSCHRNLPKPIPDDYDFHNTPLLQEHRQKMLNGQWPSDGNGCEHCRDQEQAGGMSDRLNFFARESNKRYIPIEVYSDPSLTKIKPTQLSVHFTNKCNLRCLYCGPNLSSAWVKEEWQYDQGKEYSFDPWELDSKFSSRMEKFYKWMEENYSSLKAFDLLGGEPFIMAETWECVDWMIAHPNLDCDVEIYSNMQVKPVLFQRGIEKLKELAKTVKEIRFVASIDCWGEASEYIRYGMDVETFETNMKYLLEHGDGIIPTMNWTISSLSIPYTADLIKKVIEWKKAKPISVNYNKCIDPAIFDPHIMPNGTFTKYIEEIMELNKIMLDGDPVTEEYARGIFNEIENSPTDYDKIARLKERLDQLDQRRQTDWRKTFPWLSDINEKNI